MDFKKTDFTTKYNEELRRLEERRRVGLMALRVLCVLRGFICLNAKPDRRESRMTNRTYLITGAYGFIGAWVVKTVIGGRRGDRRLRSEFRSASLALDHGWTTNLAAQVPCRRHRRRARFKPGGRAPRDHAHHPSPPGCKCHPAALTRAPEPSSNVVGNDQRLRSCSSVSGASQEDRLCQFSGSLWHDRRRASVERA